MAGESVTYALCVMTDGRRDCIVEAVKSLPNLLGRVTTRVIHDDSGDDDYTQWLRRTFPHFQIVATPGRSGFAGAYRNARAWLQTNTSEPFIFSTEDDFVVNRTVDLDGMAAVLNLHPHVVQLVLKRQPWNAEEHAAGGIIEQHPGDYQQRACWVEHRRFFSTNSSLFRRDLLDVEWPEGAHSEGHFTHRLLAGYGPVAGPDVRFAFWGQAGDPPLIEHIGHQRVGSGY